MSDNELWKTIHNNASYEISNFGRVRFTDEPQRIVPLQCQKKINKNYIDIKVGLWNKEKQKTETHYVSRLVAFHFIENPDNKKEVDHEDRNPQNNCVTNLRWVTRIENCSNTKGSNTKEKHISYINGKYVLQINRKGEKRIYKTFTTKEEAIAMRNQMFPI